ncbi:hypothetical protein ABG067_001162 [Albugo candida]|uniref:Uncharacterized protein n=1 Tax=Albugo candida TaxID=65357 RepID=A0A024FZQ4_9STRA|nr:unnamed protein product [Albugo candida]|eukprot:CCI40079.1 unnamed protein product [Albugo candida]
MKKKNAPDAVNISRQMLLANYAKTCRSMGLNTNTLIYELIRGNEEQSELYNVLLEDAGGVIGPTDLKAFTCAILISFPHYYPVSLNDEALTRTYGVGLSGTGIYTHIRCIRIWRQEVGNEGALAIASLLRCTKISITRLELLDCDIGEQGCHAIAGALGTSTSGKLHTLNLSYNRKISDGGTSKLCDGLFINTTLKELYLEYCNISAEGSIKLAQFVAMPHIALETLSLQGNDLGDEGLYHFSLGLARSVNLKRLNLADNGIRHGVAALHAFGQSLQLSKSLAHVDLTYNPIEATGAEILLKAVKTNKSKIQSFLVDSSIPPELFKQLHRPSETKSKKKKGLSKSKTKQR